MDYANEGGNMVMPVGPMGGGGSNFGFGSDGGIFLLILFLFCFMGNGWGGYAGNGNCNGNGLYPWMNQSNQINDGFRDQMLNSNITSIQNGINGIQTQLCNGFAGIEQGANARQIADMQQGFAMQTSMNQGFNGVQGQIAQFNSNNLAAIQDVKYTIATEACATRQANTANMQTVMDKLCQLELDGYRRENSDLRSQLNMAATQNMFNAETDALYNRLSSCPIPSTPVYGRTPIFTCSGNGSCSSCGGNAFYNG